MAKEANLITIATGYYSLATINANFDAINTAFANTLSLDGSTPNAMGADLDLNNNDILNVASLSTDTLSVNGVNVVSVMATPNWRGPWTTTTAYAANDLVEEDGSTYICVVAHTSGTFATDLSSSNWELFSSGAASTSVIDSVDYNVNTSGSVETAPELETWFSTEGSLHLLGPGDFLAAGSINTATTPRVTLTTGSTINGSNKPTLAIARTSPKIWPANQFWIQHYTSDRNDPTTATIARIVDTATASANPKTLRVDTTLSVDQSAPEWCGSFEMDSYSNVSSGGHTVLSAVGRKFDDGQMFAGHFQLKEQYKFAAATDVTSIVCVEMNAHSIGLDHPTANSGFGLRRILDILPKTATAVSGWDTATGNYGDGEIGTGVYIHNEGGGTGYFRYGLVVDDVNQQPTNTNVMATGIKVMTSGAFGLEVQGDNTSAAVRIDPTTSAAIGLDIAGTYSNVAIKLGTDLRMAWEGTSAIETFYDQASTDRWIIASSDTERVGFNVTSTPGVFLNSTKVVGTQESAIANPASGTAANNTAIIAILDALRSHGLIAT